MDSIKKQCLAVVEQITQARKDKLITTAKLAELTGIQQPNIARMEMGNSLPSLQTLFKLVNALDMKIVISGKKD